MRRIPSQALGATLAVGACIAPPLAAQAPLSLADRFPIGNDAVALCSAQLDRGDAVAAGMFDRAYRIACRDARVSIGTLYALRNDAGSVEALAAKQAAATRCSPSSTVRLDDLGEVEVQQCTLADSGVGYTTYRTQRGRTLYVAQGLAGYDEALRLGLRSLVLDRQVPGSVAAATAPEGQSAAFARIIAESLDRPGVRMEAYRTNLAGEYLEAAVFFDDLRTRSEDDPTTREEALLNEALQRSNLRDYAGADRLFGGVAPTSEPVLSRLRRNYLALHLLNQGQPAQALAEIRRPLAAPAGALAGAGPAIDQAISAQLNSEAPLARALTGNQEPPLTDAERARVLDAQADQIRGASLRLLGRLDEAEQALAAAQGGLAGIRDGRLASTMRLTAQVLHDRAAVAEQQRRPADAERFLREGARLMAAEYPSSSVDLLARARLAGFLARQGREEDAVALYRTGLRDAVASGQAAGLRDALAPYFAILARRGDPASVDDFFFASQAVVRLGVARTQLQFSQILSSGGDEAAALFRVSRQISREIVERQQALARLEPLAGSEPQAAQQAATLRAEIAALEGQQAQTQSQLNALPRAQVASASPVSVEELRAQLREGETYYKVFFVGDASYGIVIDRSAARVVPIAQSETAIAASVQQIRDSIRQEVNGRTYVLPFDVDAAHKLGEALVAPIRAELARSNHLIFEPDGALLKLPLNLLVTDRAGVDRYLATANDPAADPYDFTGIAWLGRTHQISTSVSARTFQIHRSTALPSAPRPYLGFGENAPVPQPQAAAQQRELGAAARCLLPSLAWSDPIPATELILAAGEIGAGPGAVVTGQQFSDAAIRERGDLGQYRILHFATHGLLTPPAPDCPPQPALLTSWGSGEISDGLLTFREVFDLNVNAQWVILSACDTASSASVEATRAADESGGGFALDGLVRAFVGAGARSVIASHWPVPERPVAATTELISGMFAAPPGTPAAVALRSAQQRLMDRSESSHPYYWAAFAIIGDGAQPLVTQ